MRNYGLETNPLSILGRFERKQDQVIQDKDQELEDNDTANKINKAQIKNNFKQNIN